MVLVGFLFFFPRSIVLSELAGPEQAKNRAGGNVHRLIQIRLSLIMASLIRLHRTNVMLDFGLMGFTSVVDFSSSLDTYVCERSRENFSPSAALAYRNAMHIYEVRPRKINATLI
jgi:hypothetical protein